MSAYDERETMAWAEHVGLAVCGVIVLSGRGQDYACQLPVRHEGPHDPR